MADRDDILVWNVEKKESYSTRDGHYYAQKRGERKEKTEVDRKKKTKRYADLTEEEKKQANKKRYELEKRRKENMTPEELRLFEERKRKARQKYYHSLSTEQKRERNKRAPIQKISEEEIREKKRERERLRYQRDKALGKRQHKAEYYSKWYQANKERLKACNKARHERNKEKLNSLPEAERLIIIEEKKRRNKESKRRQKENETEEQRERRRETRRRYWAMNGEWLLANQRQRRAAKKLKGEIQ